MPGDQDECCVRRKASVKLAQSSIEIGQRVLNSEFWFFDTCVQWIRLICYP